MEQRDRVPIRALRQARTNDLNARPRRLGSNVSGTLTAILYLKHQNWPEAISVCGAAAAPRVGFFFRLARCQPPDLTSIAFSAQ